MYLEAVGKAFFTKLNIEPLKSTSKKWPQKVKKMQISQKWSQIGKNVTAQKIHEIRFYTFLKHFIYQ